MGTLKVDTVTNVAGSGAPNATAVTVDNVALSSIPQMEYVASASTPTSPSVGSLWYSTTSDAFYMWDGTQWNTITFTPPPAWFGSRSLVGGGSPASGPTSNEIQYFANGSNTNAQDFGDLLSARYGLAAASNATRGLFAGGGTPYINVIEYVTIANTGNSVDFGDLTEVRFYLTGCGNGTYAFFIGGVSASAAIDYVTVSTAGNASDWGDLITTPSQPAYYDQWSAANESRLLVGYDSTETDRIQYVSSTTPGNAQDFGNMVTGTDKAAAVSDTTRAVYGGGGITTSDAMGYVTIATTGNATDFGDLTVSRGRCSTSASSTRGFWCGGGNGINTIDVVTIQTPGNASDFGDLVAATTLTAGTAGD